MTNKQKFKYLTYGVLVLGILAIVGLFTFAGSCSHDDGTLAACFNSATGIGGAALFMVAVAMFGLFEVTPNVRIIIGLLIVLLGLFIAFAPGNILPLCMMETMQCRAIMQPFAMVVGILSAVLGAAQAVIAWGMPR